MTDQTPHSRHSPFDSSPWQDIARIAALEAELAESQAKLARAVDALRNEVALGGEPFNDYSVRVLAENATLT